jgi:hypothetical protein
MEGALKILCTAHRRGRGLAKRIEAQEGQRETWACRMFPTCVKVTPFSHLMIDCTLTLCMQEDYFLVLEDLRIIMRFHPSAVKRRSGGETFALGLSFLGFSGADFFGSTVLDFFLKKREII